MKWILYKINNSKKKKKKRYLQNKQYGDALRLIGSLLTELKRLDDKMLLVEVQLLESKVCLELRNLPKSKVFLLLFDILCESQFFFSFFSPQRLH